MIFKFIRNLFKENSCYKILWNWIGLKSNSKKKKNTFTW